MAEDCLLEAVRGLRLAHPELGPKPLLAKLREQHPDLGAGNKEVREALAALKAESEATEAAAAAPPATAAPAPPAASDAVAAAAGGERGRSRDCSCHSSCDALRSPSRSSASFESE